MKNQKEKVTQVFDDIALKSSWESLYSGKIDRISYNFVTRQRAVEALLESCASGKALDLGCGSGDLVRFYSQKEVFYTGVDLSSQMIKRANVNYSDLVREGKAIFQVADCENLPFKDGEFNLLSAVALIEYLSDPSKVLNEINRVLKCGGYALITVPNKKCINSRIRSLLKPINSLLFPLYLRLKKSSLATMKDVKHHSYDQKEIDALMKNKGFEKVDCRYANFHIIAYPLDHLIPKIYIGLSELIVNRKLDKVFKNWSSNYIALYRKG
ncbi:MAG: methyltransferase domain-containing protein [Candidatus Omnitrophica bacterium]|nr:methyltransferase domain-containing protein [Candidatus Omnitrophota bacterium]